MSCQNEFVNADSIVVLASLADQSFDALITDPPYPNQAGLFPETISDGNWQPLVNNPNYPDYTSGDNNVTGAMTAARSVLPTPVENNPIPP